MSAQELLAAIQARAWYPVLAIALFLLLDLWKRIFPVWGPRIPEGWRFLPAVIVAAAGGFVDAYVSGARWQLACVMALYGVLAIAGTAMGIQGAVKESVLSGFGAWGGPGGAGTGPRGEQRAESDAASVKPAKPPVLPLLLLALGLTFALPVALPACGGSTPAPKSASQLVEWAAAEAYNGAVLALEIADAKNAAYLRSLAHPTDADVEASAARLDRLQRARDGLALVRSYLSGEHKGGDGRAELGDAAEATALVLEELRSRGVDVPKRAVDGLKLAAAFAKAGPS